MLVVGIPATMPERGIDRAITQAGGELALAYKAGCSLGAVYKWRRIGGVLKTVDAKRVSDVTGVPIADLIPALDYELAPPRRCGRKSKQRPASPASPTAQSVSTAR